MSIDITEHIKKVPQSVAGVFNFERRNVSTIRALHFAALRFIGVSTIQTAKHCAQA